MASAVEQALQLKNEGNAAFSSKNFILAIEKFSGAIAANPSDHVLYSNRSGAYASNQEYSKALEDAEECIRLKPDWSKGYSRKGAALHGLGRFELALEAYEEGLKIDPNNAALKDAAQLLANNMSGSYFAQYNLSFAEIIKKNENIRKYCEADPSYKNAVFSLTQAIQSDPSKISMLFDPSMDKRVQEGVLELFSFGKRPPGQSDAPAEADVKPNTGSSSKPREKSPERSSEEKQALELKEVGNKHYKKREFEAALESYDKALSLTPKDVLIMNNKAAVYLEMGEYQKCIDICEGAIEKRYDYDIDFSKVAKLYSRIGACYDRMKDYDNAIKMYEKSLVEDNTRSTRVALNEAGKKRAKAISEAYISPEISEKHKELGNEHFKARDYPAAKKEYDEAIKRNPSNPLLYSNRAAALTNLLEYPSALKDCEKAIELDPNFVKAWSRKGSLHYFMKEYNKALQAYGKGLELDPNSRECHDGKLQVIMKIQESSRSGNVDEEQVQHAMPHVTLLASRCQADPEIQKILQDPQFNIILRKISEDPSSIQEYLRDPKVADGIQKLVAAGKTAA